MSKLVPAQVPQHIQEAVGKNTEVPVEMVNNNTIILQLYFWFLLLLPSLSLSYSPFPWSAEPSYKEKAL